MMCKLLVFLLVVLIGVVINVNSWFKFGTSDVASDVGNYNLKFQQDGEERKSFYDKITDNFYNLVTDFYLYGWGLSFHFSANFKEGESFKSGILRHEAFLVEVLGISSGMKVLDIGCGVGGPALNIVEMTKAYVTGVNINQYQLDIAVKNAKDRGMENLTSWINSDFNHLPRDIVYDACYSIEAICHSPDKVRVFKEIYDTLKPGGYFASYEWVMTDLFDEKNKEHLEIKEDIEIGNGIATLEHQDEIVKALKDAGFNVLKTENVAVTSAEYPIPWYHPLLPGYYSLSSFRASGIGRIATYYFCFIGEYIGLTPKGTVQVVNMLNRGADGLVKGGETGIFTTGYLIHAQKPEL